MDNMSQRKLLNIEIGRRIQLARERAGLTQEELSEQVNRSAQFISTIERGIAGASLETIISLCEVLNVSSEWLLRGRDASPNTNLIAAKFASLSDTQLSIIDKMTDNLIDLIHTTDNE